MAAEKSFRISNAQINVYSFLITTERLWPLPWSRMKRGPTPRCWRFWKVFPVSAGPIWCWLPDGDARLLLHGSGICTPYWLVNMACSLRNQAKTGQWPCKQRLIGNRKFSRFSNFTWTAFRAPRLKKKNSRCRGTTERQIPSWAPWDPKNWWTIWCISPPI